jgi:hypothetical protein
MLKTLVRCGPALGLVLGWGMAGGAEGDAPKPVKLKPANLSPLAFTPSCIGPNAANGRRIREVWLLEGAVVPMRNRQDVQGSKGVLTIAGTKFDLTCNPDSGWTIKGDNGKSLPLKDAQTGGCETVSLPVGKKLYPVAFPFAYRSREGGNELAYRAAWVMTGKLGSTEIQLYDDNSDNAFTIEADAFTVGSGPVYARLAKTIATKSDIFAIESIASDGSQITYGKYTGDTGQVTVEWAGSKDAQAQFAFASSDGGVAFVVGGGQSVKVPPGTYKLTYGLVYGSGKDFAVVLPDKFAPVEVAKDGKVKVGLGAPYTMHFTATKEGNEVKIEPPGKRFPVSGKGGEDYREYTAVNPPEVSVNGKLIGAMSYG